MSPWEKLLEQPHSGGHFVQLYASDDATLVKNVSRYLWEGLRRGEGALVIATAEHELCFSRELDRLGADLGTILGQRQLMFWDAQQTIGRFMVDGQPDWRFFEHVVCAAMRQVRPAPGAEGLRAYGEMVGILWKARQYAAAIRLEQLWNRLLEQSSFSLYCAYAIDLFGTECQVANLESVLCTHTHIVPSQPDGSLEAALNRSMDEIFGARADALRILIKANHHAYPTAVMPTAESMVLWLRKNLPGQAEQILARARHYYGALLELPQAAG